MYRLCTKEEENKRESGIYHVFCNVVHLFILDGEEFAEYVAFFVISKRKNKQKKKIVLNLNIIIIIIKVAFNASGAWKV